MISQINNKPQNKAFDVEQAVLLYRNGLTLFPAAGVFPDGSCTCIEGLACEHIGKHPAVSGWQNFQFKGEEHIRLYWQSHPYNNFAINTKDLCVFDVDERKNGHLAFEDNILPLLSDVKTLEIETGSGGKSRHYVFRTNNKEIKNSVEIYKGLDIRTFGGLVIAPGSNHTSGGMYKIIYSGTDKTDVIHIADLPKPLEELILERQKNSSKKESFNKSNLLIPEGSRNDTLFRKGCELIGKGVSRDDIFSMLTKVNQDICQPPLSVTEIQNIITSIARYKEKNEITWKEPILDYNLKEAPALDIDQDKIPHFFKDYIIKKSQSLGVPKNAILVSIITIISGLLGAAFKIKSSKNSDYIITLNLWGIVNAPPSSRKTAVLSVLENVLKKIEDFFTQRRNAESEKNIEAIAKLKVEKKHHKKDEIEKIDEIEKKLVILKEKQAPRWIFSTNDTTPEALLLFFKDNMRGILIFRDELQGLFTSLVKNGYENLRSLLTEAWNGNKSYNMSRIGRGIIDVPSMTVSILGGSQPDVLLSIFPDELRRGFGSDGMLARFQLWSSYTSAQLKEPDSTVDYSQEKFHLDDLILKIHDLTKDFNIGNNFIYRNFYLSGESENLFKAYRRRIHQIIVDENITNQAYRSHVGKLDRLVLSLSAQFHILNSLANNTLFEDSVDKKWVESAIDIADYMNYQIYQLYFSLGKNTSANALLLKIKNKIIVDNMSVRSIYKHGWSNLKTKDDVLAAIEQVSDANWITVVKESPKGGGAPTEIVKLNPKLIEYLNSSQKLKNTVPNGQA